MRDVKEADVLRDVLAYLPLAGVMAWRQNQGGMAASYKGRSRFIRFTSQAGISDVIGVLPDGRLLAVETKRPGKKATDEQRAFLDDVARHNGLALVVSDVEQLRQALREEGYECP